MRRSWWVLSCRCSSCCSLRDLVLGRLLAALEADAHAVSEDAPVALSPGAGSRLHRERDRGLLDGPGHAVIGGLEAVLAVSPPELGSGRLRVPPGKVDPVLVSGPVDRPLRCRELAEDGPVGTDDLGASG